MNAHEVHAHETHAREMHAGEMHAHEVQYSDALMICSCMRFRSGVIPVSPAQVEGN